MTRPAPDVGSIVHYVSEGSPVLPDGTQKYPSMCRAAVVTEVHNLHDVALCVLNPAGQFFREHVQQDQSFDRCEMVLPGGSWHWSERV